MPAPTTITAIVAEADGPPPGLEMVGELAELRVAATRDQMESSLPDSDVVLVVDFRTGLLRAAWSRAQRVRWVHAASAGVDVVMFPELIDSDVIVTNARGVFDRSIAEFVLGVMLIFTKDLHTTLANQREHRWNHRESGMLAARHAVIVGAGGIGRATARLVRAVGTTVTGVARTARTGDPDFGRIIAVDQLREVLPDADFVVLAAPLTDETRGLVDARALRSMAPHAYLINVGRGPLVCEPDLVEALRHGWIAGAALDVFEQEPLPAGHPLWRMRQVIVSPHMSGDFFGWREALMRQFTDNLRRWLAGEPLHNVVDKRRGYAEMERT
jgi:phosphoglycerate dehydrogenase-like enzyme